jgi:hypothetical protein
MTSASTEAAARKLPSHVTKLAAYLQARAHAESADEPLSGGMEAIQEAILSVQTPEEFWDSDEGGMPNGQNLVDVEQTIIEFDVLTGKNTRIAKTSLGGTYLVVRSARIDNGEEIIWNTSAPLLVTKLIQAERMSMIPLRCVIRATDLGGDTAVLKLKQIPARAVPGSVA